MLAMRRDIEAGMAEHGLTAAQWQPLWKLKVGRATTAQELAFQLGVDAGSMTRLLDRLESKGLIERLRSSADRRVVELSLTAAAEVAIEHVPTVLAEVNDKHLRGFSAEEYSDLRSKIQRMLANSTWPTGAASTPVPMRRKRSQTRKP